MRGKVYWATIIILFIWALSSTAFATYYYTKTMELSSYARNLEETIGQVRVYMEKLTSNVMEAMEYASLSGNQEIAKAIEEIGNDTIKVNRVLGGEVKVRILLDYGNGSRIWYNETIISNGETLFKAMTKALKMTYKTYQYGVFIESINNVYNDPNRNMYWMWWRWDSEKKIWILGSISCDKYIPVNGEIFAWKYSNVMEWPPKPP